jgi:hypothetical protein
MKSYFEEIRLCFYIACSLIVYEQNKNSPMSPAGCNAARVSIFKRAQLFQQLFRYIDPRTLYPMYFQALSHKECC